MTEIRRILVGVDYSEYSRVAARQAVKMARSLGAELIFLHVCELATFLGSSYGAYNRPLIKNFLEQQEELLSGSMCELEEFVKEFSDCGVPMRLMVEKGYPYMELIRVIEHENIDLVVVGKHGKSGMKKIFIGSVAEKMVRKSPCSVLVVKFPSLIEQDEKEEE